MFHFSRRLMIFFAFGILAISFVWLAYGERLEINYRLRQLERLRQDDLVITENGYAIDETRDMDVFHRDRLTVLGVFFNRRYRLGTLDRNARKDLINALEEQFPENNYWELTNDNVLHAWDFTARESAWDSFVNCFLESLDLKEEERGQRPSEQPKPVTSSVPATQMAKAMVGRWSGKSFVLVTRMWKSMPKPSHVQSPENLTWSTSSHRAKQRYPGCADLAKRRTGEATVTTSPSPWEGRKRA